MKARVAFPEITESEFRVASANETTLTTFCGTLTFLEQKRETILEDKGTGVIKEA
jgi:hypothetical protein